MNMALGSERRPIASCVYYCAFRIRENLPMPKANVDLNHSFYPVFSRGDGPFVLAGMEAGIPAGIEGAARVGPGYH
jgi:hypothetical protein